LGPRSKEAARLEGGRSLYSPVGMHDFKSLGQFGMAREWLILAAHLQVVEKHTRVDDPQERKGAN